MLDTLDRATWREIAAPVAVSLVLFCAVVACAQVAKVADAVTGLGVTAGDVLQALSFSLPPLLGLLIPVASLFACLLGIGRLAVDRELLGLAAAGVSPYRLLRMPALLGTLLALLSALALTLGEPWGIRGLRQLMGRSAQRALAAGVRVGEFHEWVPGVMFYAAAAQGAMLCDVVMADVRDAALPLTIAARRGQVRPAQRAQDVLFDLHEGTVLLTPGAAADPGAAGSQSSRVISFRDGTYRLDVGRLVGNKAHNLSALQELSLDQLARLGADAGVDGSRRAWATITLHRKFAVPLAALVFALLAVPLGMASHSAARARSFLICTALVAAYYYVGRIAELAARSGRFDALAAAWLPDGLALLALLALLPGMARGGR